MLATLIPGSHLYFNCEQWPSKKRSYSAKNQLTKHFEEKGNLTKIFKSGHDEKMFKYLPISKHYLPFAPMWNF